jgi:hypothetical protein
VDDAPLVGQRQALGHFNGEVQGARFGELPAFQEIPELLAANMNVTPSASSIS